MASDILMVRANLVPVGKDQESNIEVTREIASTFNKTYGEVFPIPKALIGDGGTLVGTDGQAKMINLLGIVISFDDEVSVNKKSVACTLIQLV